MTRARVKALHDKVNSLLTMLGLDSTLDGMLPHADMLCVLRYIPQEATPEDQGHELEEEEGREETDSPVVPASPAVLPAKRPKDHEATQVGAPAQHHRATGTTGKNLPVLPPRSSPDGTTDAATGLLPTEGWHTCSNLAEDVQMLHRYYRSDITGSTGPAGTAPHNNLRPRVYLPSHRPGTTDRPTGTTGAAGLCAKMAG